MKLVRHPNGDDFEFPDTFSDSDVARAFADFDAERNRRQAEISQYQQLRNEMLGAIGKWQSEVHAARTEAALARHEAERARADADEADRLRHEMEERIQEPAPSEQPASWLECRNDALRRKLLQQGED